MKKQRLPKGWTAKQIQELAADHDNMTEDEQAAGIEAALDATLVSVPNELVPQILALIERHRRSA